MAERKIAALLAAEAQKRDKSGVVPDAARRQIAKLKAEALRAELDDAEARSFSIGKLTVEIEPCAPPPGAGGDPLCYRLSIIGPKRRVVHQDTHVVYNPPVMVVDGEDEGGNPIIVEDHKRALRQIVEGQVRKALGL